MQAKASNPITSFLKAWFGDFQREELKKFLKLGGIFALVIGVYWTLRPLKDSLFKREIFDLYRNGISYVIHFISSFNICR